MSGDLIHFLRDRLDEDEQIAQDAAGLAAVRRHWTRQALSCVVDATDGGLIVYGEGAPTSEQAQHIARWNPARVLAEVAAKRQIIDGVTARLDPTGDDGGWTSVEFETDEMAGETLRLLALPYADRPGYREEWRP